MAGEEVGNESLLHPVGLIAVLILGAMLVLLPRRFAIFPMIVMACFIPSAQRLVLMGVDFTLLRILVVFAWTRLLIRNEFAGFSWNRLDSLFLAWMLSCTAIYTLQYGTSNAFINRAGWMFDGCGMYYFFRCVLRNWDDMNRLVYGFILVSFPVALAFLIESQTGHNAFAVFGGVAEITWVREGRLRCQGAFAHAILAGCFWAAVMPWMLAYFLQGRKWIGVFGMAACLLIIVTCSSSTPLMGVIFFAVGMAFYPVRPHLRYFRWAFFVALIFLHMIMKQPVWHLLARANVLGGSSGWHRFMIMDATIKNFSKWWLLGEPNPLSWGVMEMNDITNQYILEGLRGGFLTLVLFVWGIVVAFKFVGQALRQFESSPEQRIFVWAVGTSLFIHVWTYLAVSYFGQIIMVWYLNLAMIGSIAGICSAHESMRAQAGSRGGSSVGELSTT